METNDTAPTAAAKTYRIALNGIVPGRTTYLAARPQWDAAWHSPDVSEARTYKRAANAQRVIADHGAAWAQYNARVVEV